MNGLVTYINPLITSIGPGVVMCKSCPALTLFFTGGKVKFFNQKSFTFTLNAYHHFFFTFF
jgi:hypothetical protein